MLKINSGRITDPTSLVASELSRECEKHGRLTVQFSRQDSYSPALLSSLNEACLVAQDRLEVRFYGHYGGRFDGTCLRHLPATRNLSIDCLSEIDNEDEIGRLPNLRSLSFGVFHIDRPDFLRTLQLGRLESFSLGENRKRNFDLSPLAEGQALDNLFIHGHAKGIGVVEGLPRLRKLTLSGYEKKHGLEFVAGIPALKELTLVLGGRSSLDDLSSKTLQILQIIRLQGLATLGDLSRLPTLSALRVEDQIKLTKLDLNGTNLTRLSISNCKNLTAIPGLDRQNQLKEFSVSQVALDLDDLRDRAWPPTTKSVWLFSGSRQWNQETEARLSAQNLNGKRDFWP